MAARSAQARRPRPPSTPPRSACLPKMADPGLGPACLRLRTSPEGTHSCSWPLCKVTLKVTRFQIAPERIACFGGTNNLGYDANNPTGVVVADTQDRQPEALNLRIARTLQVGSRGVIVRIGQPVRDVLDGITVPI